MQPEGTPSLGRACALLSSCSGNAGGEADVDLLITQRPGTGVQVQVLISARAAGAFIVRLGCVRLPVTNEPPASGLAASGHCWRRP